MHPWLEAYAARDGGKIGGWTPGVSTQPPVNHELIACQKAFSSTLPMTRRDAERINRINHGHQIQPSPRRCQCGFAEIDLYLHRDPMDVPLCRLAFPQTGGCSLNEWNAGLAAMKESGQTGFLTMVKVTTNTANTSPAQPEVSKPEMETERPKRMILH